VPASSNNRPRAYGNRQHAHIVTATAGLSATRAVRAHTSQASRAVAAGGTGSTACARARVRSVRGRPAHGRSARCARGGRMRRRIAHASTSPGSVGDAPLELHGAVTLGSIACSCAEAREGQRPQTRPSVRQQTVLSRGGWFPRYRPPSSPRAPQPRRARLPVDCARVWHGTARLRRCATDPRGARSPLHADAVACVGGGALRPAPPPCARVRESPSPLARALTWNPHKI